MGEVGKNHLLEAGGLIGDGLGQYRMGMAVQGDPPAADGIDQRLPLFTDQQGTVSGHHPLGVGCAGHLGEGGPQIRMADRPHGSSGSFCHIESGALEMPRMAAPRTRRQSKRFVPTTQPELSTKRRLVVPEGDWQSIRSDLELWGWSSSQLELIQAELSHGWPLQIAVRYPAMRLGTCPTGSKALG